MSETVAEFSVGTEGSGSTVATKPAFHPKEPNIEELINERLNPRQEEDNEGNTRNIYSYNGVTFSFKGREELPRHDALRNSRSKLLGESPKRFVDFEDFQEYERELQKTQANADLPEHLVINRTPLGIVEAAIELGAKDEGLIVMRDELQRGVYSQEALALIDRIVAVDMMNEEWKSVLVSEGEALVLLSLLGDEEASALVEDKVRELKDSDARRREEKRAKILENLLKQEPAEPLKIEDLVTVHATKYLPSVGPNGEYVVPTSYDATKGDLVRNTLHTALNHRVEGHGYGAWDNTPYTIVSPLSSMIEANGLPRSLNGVDTYWTRNPGENVKFPDSTLVIPGTDEQADLVSVEGNIVKFKTGNYTEDDILKLIDLYPSGRILEGQLYGAIFPLEEMGRGDSPAQLQGVDRESLRQAFQSHFVRENWDFSRHLEISRQIKKVIYANRGEPYSIPELISRLLEDAEIDVPEDYLGYVSERFQQRMWQLTNRAAVEETIRRLGFDVKPGGDYDWSDADHFAQFSKLGLDLGIDVPGGVHSATAEARLGEGWFGFNWEDQASHEEAVRDIFQRLDTKTRRAFYAAGLLFVRD